MTQTGDPFNDFLLYGAITVLSYVVFRIVHRCTTRVYWDSSDEMILVVFAFCWPIIWPLGLAYFIFKGIGVGIDMITDVVSEEVKYRNRKKRNGNVDKL